MRTVVNGVPYVVAERAAVRGCDHDRSQRATRAVAHVAITATIGHQAIAGLEQVGLFLELVQAAVVAVEDLHLQRSERRRIPWADAQAQAPKLLGDQVGESVFRTSDGLAITTMVFETPKPNNKDKKDKDVWARFAASGSDKTKDEAARIQSRVAGWTYQLGSWKEKSLIPTMDDLKAAQDNTAAQDKEPAPAAKPQ